jgi:CRISPR system Cascade subunit CasD
LVCCALGAGGEQRELLARFANLDLQVVAFVGCDHWSRARSREPLLCDFQMVGSGYDGADPWQNLMIPKTSTGKKAVGGGTKMTYRYYLQDMAFAVALQVPGELAEDIAFHLCNPVWALYLGRKCCVPTEIIYQGTFADADTALAAAGKLAGEKKRRPLFRVYQGEEEGEVMTLNDVPVQFGRRKLYRDRRVTVVPWPEPEDG